MKKTIQCSSIIYRVKNTLTRKKRPECIDHMYPLVFEFAKSDL
jgi:hypothetical protein